MKCLGINSEGVEAVTRDDGYEYEYASNYVCIAYVPSLYTLFKLVM
jgi:hypothetical protein